MATKICSFGNFGLETGPNLFGFAACRAILREYKIAQIFGKFLDAYLREKYEKVLQTFQLIIYHLIGTAFFLSGCVKRDVQHIYKLISAIYYVFGFLLTLFYYFCVYLVLNIASWPINIEWAWF